MIYYHFYPSTSEISQVGWVKKSAPIISMICWVRSASPNLPKGNPSDRKK